MTILELSNLTEHKREDYYDILLSHSTLIIKEVAKTSKAKVAGLLHIKPSAFSGVFGCIVAHDTYKGL